MRGIQLAKLETQKKTKKKDKKSKKNLTYKDIEIIVEYLVKVKSRDNTFDCFEPADIGQEIRIICFKALDHFDFEKVKENKLVNFFGRCVDNRLRNLKRDRYIRFASPCNSDCDMLHSGDDNQDMSQVCKRWLRHQERIEIQKVIKNPVSIELVGDLRDNKFEKTIEAEDIKRFLIDNIEDRLRPGLVKILTGTPKMVPIKYRREIQASVRLIMADWCG